METVPSAFCIFMLILSLTFIAENTLFERHKLFQRGQQFGGCVWKGVLQTTVGTGYLYEVVVFIAFSDLWLSYLLWQKILWIACIFKFRLMTWIIYWRLLCNFGNYFSFLMFCYFFFNLKLGRRRDRCGKNDRAQKGPLLCWPKQSHISCFQTTKGWSIYLDKGFSCFLFSVSALGYVFHLT